VIKIYIYLYFKNPLSLSDFNENLIFSTDFREMLKYKISWKSVQREPSYSVGTVGRIDKHEEANSSFTQFCEGA
jgi:hypothetical protein